MTRAHFVDQLRDLGYEPQEIGPNKVVFRYIIPVGPRVQQEIKLGFVVSDEFPLTPPSGPHVSPRLLPINSTAGIHPAFGVHESPDFGPEWQYWSRPHPSWGQTDRSVRAYMSHIRHLFDTL